MQIAQVRNLHARMPLMSPAFTNATPGAAMDMEHFVHHLMVFTGAR